MQYLLVFIGGGLGSLCRFALARYNISHDQLIPLGTLFANIISCFILGLVIQYLLTKGESANVRLFLAVGFCGGFSTFSTFSIEILDLLREGLQLYALAYILLSLLTGVLAIYFGLSAAKLF